MDRDSTRALTRAWVESPLQLLSVLDGAHCGRWGGPTLVQHRTDVPALTALVEALAPRVDPSLVTLRPSACPWTGRGTWVVGDAFSGRVQARAAAGMLPRVVVTDDGLATLHLLDLLAQGTDAPLVRARATPHPVRRALARRVHRALAAARSLEVVTALPVPPGTRAAAEASGFLVHQHDYAWASTLAQGDAPPEQLVVVGAALAADGLVRPDAYRARIADLAQEHGPLAYLPHRRQNPATLAALGSLPGVRVHHADLPVEVALLALAPGTRVRCLPSTPALTLGGLLPARGVSVEVDLIPEEWWMPGSEGFRAHLARVREDWR